LLNIAELQPSTLGRGTDGKKIKWVTIEVGTNASEDHDGNCTKYYSEGEPQKVTITSMNGKTFNVTLEKGGTVTVCDDTGVATVTD
jgi:tartrate dehydratase alpha subunit/fumarate hydratase class I-like protein